MGPRASLNVLENKRICSYILLELYLLHQKKNVNQGIWFFFVSAEFGGFWVGAAAFITLLAVFWEIKCVQKQKKLKKDMTQNFKADIICWLRMFQDGAGTNIWT